MRKLIIKTLIFYSFLAYTFTGFTALLILVELLTK